MNPGFRATGTKIVVLPEQIEETTSMGIVKYSPSELLRMKMGQTEGVVVSLGAHAYMDYLAPWCAAGDKVIFAKYVGQLREGADGQTYRLIHDTDVVGLIEVDTPQPLEPREPLGAQP